MLQWTILFLIIALLAALFGLFPVAGVAMSAAKLMCIVFLALIILSIIRGRRWPTDLV
jgi:uncharacterized membrane protein YtjA (UPF0391 family)